MKLFLKDRGGASPDPCNVLAFSPPEGNSDYARTTIQHWAQRLVSKPGNYSICGGYFNSIWDEDEPGGGGYRSSIHDWASGVDWKSRRDDLLHLPKCNTHPLKQLKGGSKIDDVCYNGPIMRLLHYTVDPDGL